MPIDRLSDDRAIEILQTVARAQAKRAGVTPGTAPSLAPSLAAELHISATPAPDGDLAREALQLLAEDPETSHAIEALANSPRPEWPVGVDRSPYRFLGGPEIALAAAVLIALQTRIKIQYKKGRWQFDLDKKAASDGLLKSLASKLLGKLAD